MNRQQKGELKWVADNMKRQPVQAAARFEALVRELSLRDRRDLRDVLAEMLAEARKSDTSPEAMAMALAPELFGDKSTIVRDPADGQLKPKSEVRS